MLIIDLMYRTVLFSYDIDEETRIASQIFVSMNVSQFDFGGHLRYD
jgi:hypothetical protein